jgi:AraC-like DNA-binding protein
LKNNLYIPRQEISASAINSIWQVEGLPELNRETIIPKGVVEVIFDLGESNSVHAKLNDKDISLPRCFISGFNTYPIHLHLPQRHSFFGIQFQPSAVTSLFKVPAGEFANYAIDLSLVNASFHSLWYQLKESYSFFQRTNVILEWIKSKDIVLHSREHLLNNFVGNPMQKTTTVKEYASALCYSPRHLSRMIHELTGMSTEQLLLYKKYLRAVHLIHTTPLSLTKIAYDCDFSDQSHFIKSFRAFAQMTPGEYREQKSNVPGHIYGNK